MAGTPAAEIEIDATMIRALLEEQHADLAGLPCVLLEAGWDNVMFRLGNALCLRMPRRALSAPLLENEQAWLPELGNRLPLPVPVPLRIGQPGVWLSVALECLCRGCRYGGRLESTGWGRKRSGWQSF